MDECIYSFKGTPRGTCGLTRNSKRKGCVASASCQDYATQASLFPPRDNSVQAGSGSDPLDVDGVGRQPGPGVVPLHDNDVPALRPTTSRADCGESIRPLVFGVARPGARHTTVPVFVMVCGRALDGKCSPPCHFGMYSIDIDRAHAGIEPAGRIITPSASVSDVRRGH